MAQPGQRGTPLWAFNKVRSDFLPSLLRDLKEAEENGWDEHACDLVKEILRQLAADSAMNDPSVPVTQTWELLDEFREKYIEWNDECQDEECRKERRLSLRAIREKIARKARNYTKDLDQHVDKLTIVGFFSRVGEVSSQHPQLFANTIKSVERFNMRNVESRTGA